MSVAEAYTVLRLAIDDCRFTSKAKKERQRTKNEVDLRKKWKKGTEQEGEREKGRKRLSFGIECLVYIDFIYILTNCRKIVKIVVSIISTKNGVICW